MKIFQTYFGILFLSLAFFSCTNDPAEQVTMVKQIVEIAKDGTSTTTIIDYDGNKIASIDNSIKHSDFYYTGLLITKIVVIDKVANHTNILGYTYSNANLVQITSSDNYVVNYIHNTDGTVSFEKLTKDTNNKDVKVNHGILYFLSSNLTKEVMTIDNTSPNILSTETNNYTYDAKSNGLKNIVGFTELMSYGPMISINNVINTTESSQETNSNTNQATSSIDIYKNEYKYNSEGYPTEIVGEKTFFGEFNSNHLKTLLYY